MADVGSFFGNIFGDSPVLGHLVESDEEKALKGQTEAARAAAEAYASYRPEYQQNQQAALANMAGLLGPMNAMLQHGGGQQLNLGAALAPVVSQEALAIGPQPAAQPVAQPVPTGPAQLPMYSNSEYFNPTGGG